MRDRSDRMPLVFDWLKYAEPTRRIINEHYKDCDGEELLNAAIEENVLTQIENLRTYPAVHSKLYSCELDIHAWVYKIETGGVFVYSAERCSIQGKHDEDDSELTEEPALPDISVNGNGKTVALSRDR